MEGIDDSRDFSRIAERFFSDEERQWLEADTKARFHMLWVLKEAFVKAHGQSIFGGLEKLHCTVEPPSINATADEGSFRALSLYQDGDMYLALATTEAPLEDVGFFKWLPLASSAKPGGDYTLVASTTQ